MTVERAKIDRVCGRSKQIIVIQKQDCAGLVLVHAVPSSTWSETARLVCPHSRRPDFLLTTLSQTLSLFGVSSGQRGASK
jgi:hypothetical protein